VPEVLKGNELLRKLFTKGWKTEIFNEEGQIVKQVAAVSIVFALLYFSTTSLIMERATNPVTVFTLIYSAASLWSFLGLVHVRDLNTISKNVMPVLLCFFATLFILTHERSIIFDAMAATLLIDVYFALRFQDGSDEIEFTMLERFCMQSWTQGAFEADNKLALQITGACFIFAELFLSITGLVANRPFQALFLTFALARLMQYVSDVFSGVRMLQSNMSGVLLALIGVTTMFGYGYFAFLQSMVMIADAYIGAAAFTMDKKD